MSVLLAELVAALKKTQPHGEHFKMIFSSNKVKPTLQNKMQLYLLKSDKNFQTYSALSNDNWQFFKLCKSVRK